MKFSSRLYRRLIIRYFGSVKCFALFICGLAFTFYCINEFFLKQQITGQASSLETSPTETTGVNITQSPEELRCGVKQICPPGKYPYFIRSGFLEDGVSTICFRGTFYVGAGKTNGRGMNMIVINEATLEVEDVKVFDTYESDDRFKEYLSKIPDYRVIFLTTQDDVTRGLTPEARALMQGFGSSAIYKVQFRENMAIVGQKGLTRGTAIEEYSVKSNNRIYGDAVQLSDCLSVPVGRMFAKAIKQLTLVNDSSANCGVEIDCGAEAFPARLYSGIDNTDLPKMCINGHHILEGVAGRGINVAVVDPKTKAVTKKEHFDTWEFSNDSFIPFLESLKENEIVIAVTHDEASRMLSDQVKTLFESLGSSYIRKLTLRDAWAFVGQKGIEGRSTIEELEFAPPGGAKWSHSIDKRLCIPLKIKGFTLKFDAPADQNTQRDQFCSTYVGFGSFCSSENRMDPLRPAPLEDASLRQHRIFTVPILVVASQEKTYFRRQLEAILAVKGIIPNAVKVYYDQSVAEYGLFIHLFGFNAIRVNVINKYSDVLKRALEDGWHDSVGYAIVLDEQVYPTSDFLHFMAQCLDVLDKDNTLFGISAWNDNGYIGPSSNMLAMNRAETFPGLGFLMKRSFYDQFMRNQLTQCCSQESWREWSIGSANGTEMIVPEVSRVMREPHDGPGNDSELLLHLFNRPRASSSGVLHNLTNLDLLVQDSYEDELERALKSAIPLTVDVKTCIAARNPDFLFSPEIKGKSYAVYFEQASTDDVLLLSELCRCFELFWFPGYRPRNMHLGLLRFSHKDNQVFLVGSASRYYIHKPVNHKALLLPASSPPVVADSKAGIV